MDKFQEKLSEYGLGLKTTFGARPIDHIQKVMEDMDNSQNAFTGKPLQVILPNMLSSFASISVTDVERFKESFHLTTTYHQLLDLVFEEISVEMEKDDYAEFYINADDRDLAKEVISYLKKNGDEYGKKNKEFALKKTFDYNRTVREMTLAQVQLAMDLMEELEENEQLKELGQELEQLFDQIYKNFKEKIVNQTGKEQTNG